MKNRQKWFSWTKSWQWTATVCPNAPESHAFPSWNAVKKTIPALAKVIVKSRNLPAYLAALWDVSRSVICNSTFSDARRRTCWESLDQQPINKSIDQLRDRLKAVVQVNGGHIEQLFWISSSFLSRSVMCIVCVLNMCAVSYCVSCGVMVLWQKVNLANNYLTFQNNISIILC